MGDLLKSKYRDFKGWWSWFWDEPKGTKDMELFKAATQQAWDAGAISMRDKCLKTVSELAVNLLDASALIEEIEIE